MCYLGACFSWVKLRRVQEEQQPQLKMARYTFFMLNNVSFWKRLISFFPRPAGESVSPWELGIPSYLQNQGHISSPACLWDTVF